MTTHFATTKLNCKFTDEDNDMSGDTNMDDKTNEVINNRQYTVDGKRVVAKMTLRIFQQYLVNHFDIRFKKNDIIWPQHIKKPQWI